MTITQARKIIKSGALLNGSTSLTDAEIQQMLVVADGFSDVAIELAKDLYKKGGKDALENWPKNV